MPFLIPPTVINAIRATRAVAAVLVLGAGSARALDLEPGIKPYEPVSGVSGNLNSIGSDTLNNVMTFWAEGFQSVYPNVKIAIEGKGSTTAPPALTAGTSQLGPMSRQMKKEELDEFEKKFGYKPTEFRVAIDGLAVFVHKDNPLTGLTLQQVDSMFSSTLKREGKNITDWGDIMPEWKGKPVSLYGRNSASGTYGYFKEHTLKKGDYKSSVKEQPGSSAVVQGVASDLAGIGYSGIGYVTSSVKALPLGEKPDALVEPTYENCLSGKYPLARFLYVYVNKKPGQPLDPLTGEFIKYIHAKEGQQIVIKDGYFPLTEKFIGEEQAKYTK